MFFEIALTI